MSYFQGAAKAASGPLEAEKIHSLILRFSTSTFLSEGLSLIDHSYIGRHDQELGELKNQRRPGRPSSAREDKILQLITTEDREYNGGFWIPDLQDQANLRTLCEWNGEWTAMNLFKYVRLSRDGTMQTSSFPPKGLS